jgi:hypothetical protein
MTFNTHLTPPDDAHSAVLWYHHRQGAACLTFLNSENTIICDWMFAHGQVSYAMYTALALAKRLDGRVAISREFRSVGEFDLPGPPHGRTPTERPQIEAELVQYVMAVWRGER